MFPLRTSQRKKAPHSRDKRMMYLQESTIKQCSYEFNQHLENLRKFECANLSNKKEKQTRERVNQSTKKAREEKQIDFSKVFSKNISRNVPNIDNYDYDINKIDPVMNVEEEDN